MSMITLDSYPDCPDELAAVCLPNTPFVESQSVPKDALEQLTLELDALQIDSRQAASLRELLHRLKDERNSEALKQKKHFAIKISALEAENAFLAKERDMLQQQVSDLESEIADHARKRTSTKKASLVDCVHDSAVTPVESHRNEPHRRSPRKSVKVRLKNTRITVLASYTQSFSWSKRFEFYVANIMQSLAVKCILGVAMVIAVVGSMFYTVFDVADGAGSVVFDAILILIMLLFTCEIIGNCIYDRPYRCSFFFWMDILGTFSLIFEISFLLSSVSNVGTVVLRTARLARSGIRAMRALKLLKCVSVWHRAKAKRDHGGLPNSQKQELSQKVINVLSTKVSAVAVVLMLVLPLLELPAVLTDHSETVWVDRLEFAYAMSVNTTNWNYFLDAVRNLEDFYKDFLYFPYKLEGFDVPSYGIILDDAAPARNANSFRYQTTSCLVSRPGCDGIHVSSILFNFTRAEQLSAGMDIASVAFTLCVMIIVAFDLSRTIDWFLMAPLERMLHVIRVQMADVCNNLLTASRGQDAIQDEEDEGMDELELLENTLVKLTKLAKFLLRDNTKIDAEEMEHMDDAAKGVLVDMMNVEVTTAAPLVRKGKRIVGQTLKGNTLQGVQSWHFDALGLDDDNATIVLHYLFFDFNFGAANLFVEDVTFSNAVDIVKSLYNDLPYHCFRHAIDVLHCVSQTINLTNASEWVSEIEIYALLVAALCHDVGHFGKTNQFLVESQHELALRYNDKSPLENLHCSTLFQICCREGCDLFEKATVADRKAARKVCIATILHTDNALHFEMVKSISVLYEQNSSTCDTQAGFGRNLTSAYAEMLGNDRLLFLELFLHFADVSNPLKPFLLCKAWARRVLDEFFAQGDEEKRLGLPVGMLNDRARVNEPGSQHGFIVFLVDPLVCSTVKVFPSLFHLYNQMYYNLENWRDAWISEAVPQEDEITKKAHDLLRIKTEQDRMRQFLAEDLINPQKTEGR